MCNTVCAVHWCSPKLSLMPLAGKKLGVCHLYFPTVPVLETGGSHILPNGSYIL